MPLSKRNRRGVLGVIVIGVSLMFTPRIVKSFSKEVDVKISLSDVLEFENHVASSKQDKRDFKRAKVKTHTYKAPEKSFDPNDYTIEDWKKLGLSNRQAEVVTQFIENGVYSDEQLKKIYVLPIELFDLIVDSTYYNIKLSKQISFRKEPLKVDLNLSNKTELMSLQGIGPYYAEQIIIYREKLGGYLSESQLLEIWKFDAEKLDNIRSNIILTNYHIKQFNINTVSIEELKSHPYISYNVANSIVKMRHAKGNYKALSELKESRLIDEELFLKIEPYLTLE